MRSSSQAPLAACLLFGIFTFFLSNLGTLFVGAPRGADRGFASSRTLSNPERAAAVACGATVPNQRAVSVAVGEDEQPKYSFEYGWSNNDGKWINKPDDGQKWWQKPSYLTPYGYPEPPHWHESTYNLCLEEFRFAMIEKACMADLKEKGMNREEIDARAKMFEFLEDDDKPMMTDKMRFLMQLDQLNAGCDHDHLVDMRADPSPTPLKRKGTHALPDFTPNSA